MDITITSEEFSPDNLIVMLEGMPGWQPQNVQLALQKKEQAFRTLDPTVVVAIITAASAGLGALLTGLLSIAKETKSKVIVLQDKDGRRLEIPADTPTEKIQELMEVVRQMEKPRILIP